MDPIFPADTPGNMAADRRHKRVHDHIPDTFLLKDFFASLGGFFEEALHLEGELGLARVAQHIAVGFRHNAGDAVAEIFV